MFKIGNTWFILVYWVAKKKKKLMKKSRSSHPEVFRKKQVLENFTEFTEKQLCWISLFTGLRCFHVHFLGICQIFRNTYFVKHLNGCFWKSCSFKFSCTITDTICWNNFVTYPRLILLYYLCQILKEKATIF